MPVTFSFRSKPLFATSAYLVLCFVGLHLSGLGQTQPATRHQARTASKASGHEAPRADIGERAQQSPDESTKVLRAQLDVVRDYDQRLLATVHWSLGVSVGVVLVLVTVIGIVNFRFYERDKAALRQELMGLLREEVAKSDQALRGGITDFQHRLQGEATSRHESLVESLKRIAEASIGPVRGEIERLRYDLKNMEYKQLETEAARWMGKGTYSNVLSVCLKMLEIGLEFEMDWRVSDTLGRMKASLQAIVQTGQSPPDAALAKDLSLAIDRLPGGFSTDADLLRTLLQSARAI